MRFVRMRKVKGSAQFYFWPWDFLLSRRLIKLPGGSRHARRWGSISQYGDRLSVSLSEGQDQILGTRPGGGNSKAEFERLMDMSWHGTLPHCSSHGESTYVFTVSSFYIRPEAWLWLISFGVYVANSPLQRLRLFVSRAPSRNGGI